MEVGSAADNVEDEEEEEEPCIESSRLEVAVVAAADIESVEEEEEGDDAGNVDQGESKDHPEVEVVVPGTGIVADMPVAVVAR